MNNNNEMRPLKPLARLRSALTALLIAGALCPLAALAQVPARFYLKTLTNANAVPLIFNSLSGNSNPFDPSHTVLAGGGVDASLAIAGFARTFAVGDRSALGAILLPMGRVSGDVTVAGRSFSQAANGFGDPMLEFDVNVVGPTAQKNLPDVLRYQPGLSVDLIGDLAIPIGNYDSSQPLNLGQHRWYGRIGAPVVWQLGEWVPGRRTTLEFLPALWMFGTNDDFVGQKLETDPMFQLDAHLTRDLAEYLWGALDVVYYAHGKSSINGVDGKNIDILGYGLTFGYTISDNLNLTVGYKSTRHDTAPDALRMDSFMVSLVFGWHPLLEGARRLKGER